MHHRKVLKQTIYPEYHNIIIIIFYFICKES